MSADGCHDDYNYLYERIGKGDREKGFAIFCSKYRWLASELENYVNKPKLKGRVSLNYNVLAEVVHDFFADIERLKDFHEIIDPNDSKNHAYTAYWLCRRKPIQVKIDHNPQHDNLSHVNELFVASMLYAKTKIKNSFCVNKFESCQNNINKFRTSLFYNLKYRVYTPQTLELMIEALILGGTSFSQNSATTGSKPVG